MKGLPKFSKEYFEQFRETPLELKPFNPKAKVVANNYINKISTAITDKSVIVTLRGSTAFEILGKGDIDIAVYANKKLYSNTFEILKSLFGNPTASGKEFSAFQFKDGEFDIEVSLMTGHEAKVDQKLTEYLLQNKNLLLDYETLKKKYCYSKREYVLQRDKFLRQVISQIRE